jgi:glutamate formiminotransferase / 5-formyltetrahydrofolate cyclo-ligase
LALERPNGSSRRSSTDWSQRAALTRPGGPIAAPAPCHDSGVLVESVPNYSEGRRLDVVDRLAAAARSVDGAYLLDRTSDASHNRSVLTLAGESDSVERALEATIEAAIELIDMEQHSGEHPRIGAVDVIPFVPLGGTTMDDAIELARSFGARVAERFELPVYLYAQAATRADRIRLADVRRGGYEGLRDEIDEPERRPDFGPRGTHPRAGAVAVGARPFLIAWNINLETDDVAVAKRIAREIRESGGGLPAVQANGFMIDELDAAQVSMNLLDFERTPMWRVWDEVAAMAEEEGVGIRESELIGLAPQAAFDAVAAHADATTDADPEARFAAAARYLMLRDAQPQMVLEHRLAAARATTP